MPSDSGLKDLARTYLETQHRLWPELATSGQIPTVIDANITNLAGQFKRGFLNKEIGSPPAAAKLAGKGLAASYLRYSCDNSNPRSLDQQLRLQLERARQNGHFIPWAYVFADAAVTGTTAKRSGYEMAKMALAAEDRAIEALYIDEVGRASRDMVEALLLGRLIDKVHKRLIGVSDGFDTQTPMSKLHLSIFAALQEWFIDQLRSKVDRGMKDAFDRGTNTGLPPVGYRLVPAKDANGTPLRGKDGEHLRTLAVDDATRRYVVMAFTLYAARGRSLCRLGRLFNRLKVNGQQTWDGSRIRHLLKRRLYVGVQTYRMTRQVIDPDTGTVKVVKRSRKEWLVRRARHLQIVEWRLWKRVQQRLKECGRAFFKNGRPERGRTELYPKVLIRPVCGVCGSAMALGHSAKYRSLTCLNGAHGKHGCTFRGYKSVTIVENAVLDYLRKHVLTEDRINEVVAKANEYLTAEAAKPRADVAPLRATAQKIKAARDRLARVLERAGTENLDAAVARLRQHEKRLVHLRQRLRQADAQNHVPPPIDRAAAENILADLRGLLNQDVARAASIIRELTGPIVIHQRQEAGKARATWFAEFTVNMVPVVGKLTRGRNCPTACTWEYLKTRGWTIPWTVSVTIRHAPQYEVLGAEFKRLHEAGASVQTIAAAHGMPWKQAKDILHFGLTGERPKWKNHPRPGTRKGQVPLYIQIAPDVARWRDEEQLSWPRIIARLAQQGVNVGENTVRRAYDRAHPEIARAAAACGQTPKRGRYSHISPGKKQGIRELLAEGTMTTAEIARLAGCSVQTVERQKGATQAANPI